MAEEKYRRLTCGTCDADLVQHVGRGRPRKFCASCRPTKSALATLAAASLQECQYCGSNFQSARKRKYCSDRCTRRAVDAARYARTSSERGVLHEKACAECGDHFKHSWRGGVMYCSKSCKQRAWGKKIGAALSAEEARRRHAVATQRRADRAMRSAERKASLAARQAHLEAQKAARPTRCAVCKTSFGDVVRIGRGRLYCSAACRRLSPVTLAAKAKYRLTDQFKASKRARKKARRAVKRRCGADTFNTRHVFERDGWKCQRCGVTTPKSLIGSNKSREPTHDHIVALANGGPHTLENSQTLCRGCNTVKAAGAPVGQIGLFTDLLNELIPARRRPSAKQTTPEPAQVAGSSFSESA